MAVGACTLRSGRPITGMVLLAASANSLYASWTGKPTATGKLTTDIAKFLTKDESLHEFAQKTGDLVQSLASGGVTSYIKTATRSGDAVDAAGAVGVVNDGQNYKEAIRIVECSGRIDCKGK